MPQKPAQQAAGSPWLVAVVVLVLTGVLFGPALTGRRAFGFRDAAHFYYPLFEWTQSEWEAGRVPLWNPLDNTGSPVVAEATSSVFYPGKLIFWFPLPFLVVFNAYVVGHLLLASAGAYWCGRSWGASRYAAGIATLAYAFSGQVLFQYCNVVFLVSAAWLPFALRWGESTIRSRRWPDACRTAAAVALMALGGDPQLSYLTLLALVGLAWMSARHARRTSPSVPVPWHRRRAVLGCAVAAGAAAMAAVQILPTWHWSRGSHRAAYDTPRTVYEAASHVRHGGDARAVWHGLVAPPPAESHHRKIYEFSVGPWRWIEAVAPNAYGRIFPRHQRWIRAFPSAGREWTPSLYAGLLPLLFGISAFRLRRGSTRVRWLSWMGLLATIAALGAYGPGWIAQEVAGVMGHDPQSVGVARGTGGLYWFMVVFLPGYVGFRYPAKLMVLAAFALSMLAAKGMDRWIASEGPRLTRIAAWLTVIGASGACVLLVIMPFTASWAASLEPDEVFGLPDGFGAAMGAALTMAHLAVVAAAGRYLLTRPRPCRGWTPASLVVLTALDLAVAQYWMIADVPAEAVAAPAQTVPEAVAQATAQSTAGRTRLIREPDRHWVPNSWLMQSSADRLTESAVWDRETLFIKWHLGPRLANLTAAGTLTSLDLRTFWNQANALNAAHPGPDLYVDVAGILSGEFMLLPQGVGPQPLEAWEPIGGGVENAAWWQAKSANGRCWIVHEVTALDPLATLPRQDAVIQRVHEVLQTAEGVPRDLMEEAVVAAAVPPPVERLPADGPPESCRIVEDRPNRVILDVELHVPGVVVLNDLYTRDWRVHVDSGGELEEAELLRANRVMRGVALPAGRHRVLFRYRPNGFYLGAVVSSLAWGLLLLGALLIRVRRLRLPAVTPSKSASERAAPDTPRRNA